MQQIWGQRWLGINEEPLKTRAIEVTGNHIGDVPLLTDLLG